MPVDLYVGGVEHAVLHLLYSRFWHHVLYDCGLVSTPEPFQRLVNQGMILGFSYKYYEDSVGKRYSYKDVQKIPSDGAQESVYALVSNPEVSLSVKYVPVGDVVWHEEAPYHPEEQLDNQAVELELQTDKMSKSRGNVVNPDDVIKQYGADALRCYEMFMGPLEQVKPWNTRSVAGVSRFLGRAWSLIIAETGALHPNLVDQPLDPQASLTRLLHKTIQKVTDDIEGMRFHTAISALMVLVNEAHKADHLPRTLGEQLVLLLAPFAPHLGEELWQRLGHRKTLAYEAWPSYDPELIREETKTIPIQINGKVRAKIDIPANADQAMILAAARAHEKIQSYLEGKILRREVVIPGRMVNFVVS